MGKFRKKPVEIEAVKYGNREYADNPLVFDELPDWLVDAIKNEKIIPEFKSEDYWYLGIHTLEGVMYAGPDDFIVRGIAGELYPCKPDIFAKTYEPAEAESHTLSVLRGLRERMVSGLGCPVKSQDNAVQKVFEAGYERCQMDRIDLIDEAIRNEGGEA